MKIIPWSITSYKPYFVLPDQVSHGCNPAKNKFQIIIMGHRESLSHLTFSNSNITMKIIARFPTVKSGRLKLITFSSISWHSSPSSPPQKHRRQQRCVLSFAPFFDSCQSKRSNREREKVDIFLYWLKQAKAANNREISRHWRFRKKQNKARKRENWLRQHLSEIQKQAHFIWKKRQLFQVFKLKRDRPKSFNIFRFACKSQIKKVIF